MHPFEALLQGERLPPLRRIRYDLPSPRLKDPAAVLRQELRASGVLRPLRLGQTVAIAAGSREITNLALLVRTLIAALQEKGARPFLVPAMGSHGGATAEGQREILRGYGLSEEALGVPVLSSMETVCLAHTPQHNYPVYLDRFAAQADWIIPIGRIKPHTDIRGPIQSGVAKLPVIMPNERLAFQLALHTATETDRARGCRLMWIQDTNHLGEFYVSPALLPEAEQNPLLRVLPGTFEVDYAPDGSVAGFVPAVP